MHAGRKFTECMQTWKNIEYYHMRTFVFENFPKSTHDFILADTDTKPIVGIGIGYIGLADHRLNPNIEKPIFT